MNDTPRVAEDPVQRRQRLYYEIMTARLFYQKPVRHQPKKTTRAERRER